MFQVVNYSIVIDDFEMTLIASQLCCSEIEHVLFLFSFDVF